MVDRPKGDPDFLHKREYERACQDVFSFHNRSLPAWDKLTDEEKETVRNANNDYWREMNEAMQKVLEE